MSCSPALKSIDSIPCFPVHSQSFQCPILPVYESSHNLRVPSFVLSITLWNNIILVCLCKIQGTGISGFTMTP